MPLLPDSIDAPIKRINYNEPILALVTIMFRLIRLVALGVIAIWSPIFVGLAVVTSSMAFTILFLRVVVVSAEIAAAWVRGLLLPHSLKARAPQDPRRHPTSPIRFSPKSRRSSRGSADSPVPARLQTPLNNASSVTLGGPLPVRDYEGIGGWRVMDDEEDDALWLNASGSRDFSSRSISRPASGFASPERVRTPLTVRTAAVPRSRRAGSGSASPEGYFNMPFTPVTTGRVGGGGSSVSLAGRGRAARQQDPPGYQ